MLEDFDAPRRNITCKVKEIANTLSDKDSVIFLQAIDDKDKWPTQTLSNELRKRGVSISPTPIRHHRGRHCVCFR